MTTDELWEQLRASIICQPYIWPGDIDDMATVYESELAATSDRLNPFREVTRRPRTSDPWFDKDCFEPSASLAVLNVHTLKLPEI